MEVSEAKRLRALEDENSRLKRFREKVVKLFLKFISHLVADQAVADSHSQGGQRKKVVSPSARRRAVKDECGRRLGWQRPGRWDSRGRATIGAAQMIRAWRAWRIRKEVLELSAQHPSTDIAALPR